MSQNTHVSTRDERPEHEILCARPGRGKASPVRPLCPTIHRLAGDEEQELFPDKTFPFLLIAALPKIQNRVFRRISISVSDTIIFCRSWHSFISADITAAGKKQGLLECIPPVLLQKTPRKSCRRGAARKNCKKQESRQHKAHTDMQPYA